MPESRESRQDTALVALLNALPPERLTRVLVGVGIEAERVEAATRKPDDRRCTQCGHGYVRCRALDAKNPDPEARHEWSPNKNRAGIPTQRPESEQP